MDNFYNSCRLCYSKSGLMIPLFSRITGDKSLSSKLSDFADVDIFADDHGSRVMCQKCAHQVEQAYLLKQKCEELMKPLEGWNVQCCFCNADTRSCSDLENHIKVSHRTKETFCIPCNQNFPLLSLYLAHCLRLHRRCSYSCKQCGLKFHREESFEEHLKIHDGELLICKYCEKSFIDDNAWNEHMEAHDEERTCHHCNILFFSKEDCQAHMTDTKACPNVYSCRFCNEMFSEMKTMIQHVTIFHEDGLVHRCDKCQTIVTKEIERSTHVCKPCCSPGSKGCPSCVKPSPPNSPSVRQGKVYQCRYCPRKFRGKGAWETHMRTHTGELPFTCGQCKKGFRQKANLMMHIFRNHKTEQVAPRAEPMPFTMDTPAYLMQPAAYTIDPSQVFEHLDMDYAANTAYQ